jgi:6-phosphogluconolactonase (cycloisomerase 2 family)
VAVAVVAAATVALPLAASGKPTPPRVVGAVYTETNNPAGNKVLVFNRYSNGRLKRRQAVATGGRGGQQQQPGCTAHCPILDAAGEIQLVLGGRVLVVVNAGSNTITSFRVTSQGLERAATKSSGGRFPDSLTTHGSLLYVLNTNTRNIAGFRVSSDGKLMRIKRSTRSLTGNADSGGPRQIAFDNKGRVLVVTLLTSAGAMSSNRTINTFVLRANGTPGPATAYSASQAAPFGVAFDPRRNHMVLTEAPRFTSTYTVTRKGAVVPIDVQSSNGAAPCWVAITGNGRYAYTVNTGGSLATPPSVAQYRLSPNGKLTFLGITPNPHAEHFKTDNALSADSKYLYVLAPGVTTGPSRIDVYKLGGNGTLKLVASTPRLPPGISGVSAT